MNKTILILKTLLLIGCTTSESLTQPKFLQTIQKDELFLPPTHYVIVREPHYITAPAISETQEEQNTNLEPQDEVAKEVDDGTVIPGKEHSRWDGTVLEYDYDPGLIYHVYTSPFRITDIELQQGEALSGELIIGDSARWIIADGTSNEQTHIYLKPIQTNLETTLIINTDRRRYYLIIRSYDQKYMIGVRWRYPLDELKNLVKNKAAVVSEEEDHVPRALHQGQNLDLFSFDYKMNYRKKLSLPWKPTAIYDDGQKTYLRLSPDALNYELPVIHAGKGKNKELVNYRITETTLILDRLITDAEMSLEKDHIKITKKVSR